ncbi:isochorismatase domain-containing protein 2-like [Prorops nasuta]|uniref:isochorismatase domain-containing protein 2-like n=1 Tax=Prorops nasuta TaxID=863751 RepID=UPI0034CFAFA8
MAINAARALVKPARTALLICDLQDKFSTAIHEFNSIVQNSIRLMNALNILKVPMLVTEHNPKSLGKTVPELDISSAMLFSKTSFSMFTPEVENAISTICNGSKPESIILLGIEAHVCVENTAIDLRRHGFEVHNVADCMSSRTQENRLLALQRMQQMGCQTTTVENILFKLMGDCTHKEFKNVLNIIKTPSIPTGLV